MQLLLALALPLLAQGAAISLGESNPVLHEQNMYLHNHQSLASSRELWGALEQQWQNRKH
jgi:hypothetical protein